MIALGTKKEIINLGGMYVENQTQSFAATPFLIVKIDFNSLQIGCDITV